MKSKLQPMFLSVITFLIFFLVGCNKSANETSCIISKPTAVVNLTVGENTSPFSLWVGAFRNDPDKSYALARSNKSSTNYELQEILLTFGVNLKQEIDYSKIISLIAFVNKSIEQDSIIKTNDLKAFLIYSKTNKDQLRLNLVRNEYGKFILDSEFDAITNAISSNHIYSLATVFKASKNEKFTSVEFANHGQLYKRSGKENIDLKLFRYIKQ